MKLLGAFLLAAFFAIGAQSQSCSSTDAELLRQRRLRTLKANILAQLSPSLPDDNNVTSVPPTPEEEEEATETFYALRNASASLEREKHKKCRSDDFFAKPVTFFVGEMSQEELVPSDVVKRQAGSGSGSGSDEGTGQGNILNSYKISIDFELPENLSDVSQADLLLYQEPSVLPHQDVRDLRQYVEIRTVLESFHQRLVVEGKYVDLYKMGYEVFDITSAAKLWVAKGITGSAVLEVVIYCYSSVNCAQPNTNGELPAKVVYNYATTDAKKSPRVVIISKNPIEAEHQKRYRRDTGPSGVTECVANQTTCCLKPLTINFHEDLDFDFVILPTEFQANYCEGVCPGQPTIEPALMTPRIFEFLSRLGDGNPASAVEPCCAGNEYGSLEVLMKVNGVLMIEVLQQVVVTSCRCA